jgi:hypothetical protein
MSLPAGPLVNAVDAVSKATGAMIGASDPAVLLRTIPAIRARGAARELIMLIAKRAHLRVLDMGRNRWLFVQPARRAPPFNHAASSPDIVVQAMKRDVAIADVPASINEMRGEADLDHHRLGQWA